MKKKSICFFSIIICCFFSIKAIAQNHHAFYLEAGGAAITGSVNYDFRLKQKVTIGSWTNGIRIGIGFSPKYILNTTTQFVENTKGIKLTALIGYNSFMDMSYVRAGSDIEYGINFLYAPPNSIADRKGNAVSKNRIIPSLNIGYRHQDESKMKRMFRICYTPFFLDGKLCHWVGLSFGFHTN
jgi:hypothetical protein